MPYKNKDSPAAMESSRRRQEKYRNSEHGKQNKKEYMQSDYGREALKKRATIGSWKKRGIIDGDFDSLYDLVQKETNCWICDKVYPDSTERHVDHDHDIDDDDNVRYICCRACNCYILKKMN